MIHVGHWPVQWSLVLNLNRLCFWGEKYWLVVLFIHLDWKQKCQLTVTVKFSLFLLFIQNNCVNFNQTSLGEWNLRFYKWEIVTFSKYTMICNPIFFRPTWRYNHRYFQTFFIVRKCFTGEECGPWAASNRVQ